MQLDESIDGFGASVVGAAGGEVRQERLTPLVQGPAEAGDLGDRAGRERGQDVLRDPAALGEVFAVERGPQLLRREPGDEDLGVTVVSVDGGGEPGALAFGEPLDPRPPDMVRSFMRGLGSP